MDLPRPDTALPHLADVTPALLSALGAPGFEDRIGLPGPVRGAAVLLIDGLGAELLDTFAADAPVLAGLRGRTLQVGFPATTVAGLAAVGTGHRSGRHGMVGMTFRLPGAGVLNALRWQPVDGGLSPEQVQPMPTVFERAAGIAVRVISAAQFAESGLTRAVLRGGRYIGVLGIGDLAAQVCAAVAEGGLCYGYHADLDLLGHLYGPGSQPWRMQLRQVDRLVESIMVALPPGAMLAVVADHGMVAAGEKVDIESDPVLQEGVSMIAGEPRARHVHTDAPESVAWIWREVLGDRAWVATREQAIAAGWFGDTVSDAVRPRIGDVVVAARDTVILTRPRAEPMESNLLGQHGSLTSAEQRVPLLLAHG